MKKITIALFVLTLYCVYQWIKTENSSWEPWSVLFATISTILSHYFPNNGNASDTSVLIGGENSLIEDSSIKSTKINIFNGIFFGKGNKIIKK